jgi:uncharacterized repeat protein (TIGR01451 family)
MTSHSSDSRREWRDWSIIAFIILMGLLCLIAAGTLAIRFPPSWKLAANMDSLLDPNSDFLTRRPQGFIEPVDQSILTPAAWLGFFQTPGVTVLPPTLLPTNTQAAAATPTTQIIATSNPTITPTSTFIFIPAPATHTSTSAPPPQPTATNTPPPLVDLKITKTDGVTVYSTGSVLTYTITVTNNGPSNVTGAVITDAIPVQLNSWGWKCTAQTGGATGCDSVAGNNANFSDTVNLPNGASIVYTVVARVLPGASGDLVNTAVVTAPVAYIEIDLLNNVSIDTDLFLPTATLPIGNIGDALDGLTDLVAPGSSVTIRLSTPLTVNGHAGYDLVYYELANGAGIQMDLVVLEIGDGNTWYTVFYWGDDAADTNSNMDIGVIGGTETDNRDFSALPDAAVLYNGTGVTIELDGVVPPGTYPYFRILSPPSAAHPSGVDTDGGCDVDAIVILP